MLWDPCRLLILKGLLLPSFVTPFESVTLASCGLLLVRSTLPPTDMADIRPDMRSVASEDGKKVCCSHEMYVLMATI